jgi:hypothetical protein
MRTYSEGMHTLLLSLLFLGMPALASVRIEVLDAQGKAMTVEEHAVLAELLLDRGDFAQICPPAQRRCRVLALQLEQGSYRAAVHDYAWNETWEVQGSLDGGLAQVAPWEGEAPLPGPAELEDAVELLKLDPELGPMIRSGQLVPYPPMPPLVPDYGLPASARGLRVLNVGLRPARGQAASLHRMVGAELGTGQVLALDPREIASCADEEFCGYEPSGQWPTGRGLEGQATLRVMQGAAELWRFTVVRPSSSTGALGSAIELRDVRYRGKPLMARVNTPLTNVQYENDECGPYRDWGYDEHPFEAEGVDVAPGIRIASAAPKTIAESGQDHGSFRGVAIHRDGDKVRIVTELSAGWYRYIPEYTLLPDGNFQPRWGFTAVKDSCVCKDHRHHTYWRFEMAPGGHEGLVVEKGDWATWEPVTREEKFQREEGKFVLWRFRNSLSGEVYWTYPPKSDGVADAYARGDNWVLRARESEMSDGHMSVYQDTEAELDKFLDGESLDGEPVAFWYAAHLLHDTPEKEHETHWVGPNFMLSHW